MPELGPDVIRRAQENDGTAFEEIYRCYAGMVYRVALRMTRRVEEAEEVTQEVFVAVHRHLKTFAGNAELKTWIYRIAVNCSLNALKKNKRNPEVSWDEGFDPQDPRQGVAEAVEKEAREAKVASLLGALNTDQKMCLVLRAQEGLSYDEIARALNININTVRSRLKRARETLMALGKGKRGSL
jgi:RNA polymerase sigma-70 factor (ECF subfamily)